MLHDLQEVLRAYWQQFIVVLPRLVLALVLFVIIWAVAARLRKYLNRKLSAKSDDPLLTSFLTQMGRWLVVLVGLLSASPS